MNLIVCHNIKFDYQALKTEGITIANGACTLAMANFVDENRFDHSLDGLSRSILKDAKDDTAIKIFTKHFGWDQIPWAVLEPYAKKDAELCYALFEHFYPQIDDFLLIKREFAFMKIIAEMEMMGIETDSGLVKERIDYGNKRMEQIEVELGFDPKKPSLLSKYLHETLGLPILTRTKTGRPAMDKRTMERYDELLEGLPILEYRGWQKATSSYYQKLLDLGPIIHPDYQLHGTVTGRLSCKSPNLQQIPRAGDNSWQISTKEVFIPRSGTRLVEYDYSQLEFRLCASYANEQSLLTAFSDPSGDVFTRMAEELELPRQTTKTLTYALLYGAGVRRISNVLNIPEFEAGKLRDKFYNTYTGIFRLSKATEGAAIQRGYIKLWSGKIRHLDREHSYKAMNSLIQGGAAELVKEAMLILRGHLDPDNCRMLLQIHDAIVFEIREDAVSTYDELIRDVMTNFPQFRVNFAVDAHDFRTGGKI